MHFAILDFEEKTDEHGKYITYNISINGGSHSNLRYRQLRELHEQLKKDFGPDRIPNIFPPKKLLSLNPTQVDERRELLEKYLQSVSQDSKIVSSKTFVKFLLKAQKETNNVEEEDTKLDLYLMNGKKFQVDVRTTDSTDHVMQEAMTHIKLPENMIKYFALFLVKREEDGEISVVRKLQGFESPYLVLLTLKDTHRLVVRKNFWSSKTEDELYKDKTALNLLFVQAVSDVERDWIITTPEALKELENLKTQNNRKKYLKLARTQKFYGYLQFQPCVIDFPESDSHVIISIGCFELNFRLIGTQKTKGKEGSFKVTRIKCWRVVSNRNAKDGEVVTKVAFEYLFSKEKLDWITITSNQAMLMSLCLQSMVDEIVGDKPKTKSSSSERPKVAAPVAKPSPKPSSKEQPAKEQPSPKPSSKEQPAKEQSAKDQSTKDQSAKEQSSKPTTAPEKEKNVTPHKRDSVSSSDSNDGSKDQKDGTEESEQPSSGKEASKKGKKHRKNVATVKNEVFAPDIGDEDL